MTRALIWTYVGSALAVIAFAITPAVRTRKAPSIQLHTSTAQTFTLFGHQVSLQVDITPSRPETPDHSWLLPSTGEIPSLEDARLCAVAP